MLMNCDGYDPLSIEEIGDIFDDRELAILLSNNIDIDKIMMVIERYVREEILYPSSFNI